MSYNFHFELQEALFEGIGDDAIMYAFRDKKTQLLVGYDGYDTTFSRGISAFIKEHELLENFNTKLITKTHPEILKMLNDLPVNDKIWNELGGFANLEIIRLNVQVTGEAYTPGALLNMFNNQDLEVDYNIGIDYSEDGTP
jgi:hypothetical protein